MNWCKLRNLFISTLICQQTSIHKSFHNLDPTVTKRNWRKGILVDFCMHFFWEEQLILKRKEMDWDKTWIKVTFSLNQFSKNMGVREKGIVGRANCCLGNIKYALYIEKEIQRYKIFLFSNIQLSVSTVWEP